MWRREEVVRPGKEEDELISCLVLSSSSPTTLPRQAPLYPPPEVIGEWDLERRAKERVESSSWLGRKWEEEEGGG